ncbi:MAG: DUF692 domain-containing protein [Deltaproteobacteria bacterium]|nr:DUF692 domain-containing protein [Deltaproteobacteria bacterium]
MANLKSTPKPSFESECKGGAGLRPCHYPFLESNPPTQIDWFESISENYMNSNGRPRRMLRFIREHYPLALHGVSMSLASAEGLNKNYLQRLKNLIDELEPSIVSDHLCWTGNAHGKLHDLLPFPYTRESLDIVVNNLDQAQNFLQRRMVFENVSTYMTFRESEMTEWEFVLETARRSGAKILLDINNIYVSAVNHRFDPYAYLDAIPAELVGQIHLAGYSDMGDFLFDTHSKPVYADVWKLFSHYIKRAPDVPFMIEWDEDIPKFPRLEIEVVKAKKIWEQHHATRRLSKEIRSLRSAVEERSRAC